MLIKRRQFIQVGSLATASFLVPKFLKAFEGGAMVPAGNKVVVILQLSGGNDGLNTVIPVRNDIYYRSRPRLGILNSVGYPNPDRSHFRSMDIWQTGTQSNEYLNSGWIGRYLDAQCNGCDKPTQALEIDDMLSLALKGDHIKGLALKDPKRLYGISNEKYFKEISKQHINDHHDEQPVEYL